VMEAVNIRNEERYARAAAEITDWEEFGSDDPQVLLCAYGISARLCEGAVMRAEEAGVRLRLLRPKTVFPFPTAPIREWSERVDAMLVVELSMGQFVEDVRLAVEGRCPVDMLGRAGGNMPTVSEVLAKVRDVATKAGVAL